jgi:hypothetical protein
LKRWTAVMTVLVANVLWSTAFYSMLHTAVLVLNNQRDNGPPPGTSFLVLVLTATTSTPSPTPVASDNVL